MGTWPDTFVETPNGVRTVFTLASGLTPTNEVIFIAGLKVENSDFIHTGPVYTFGFAPQPGDGMDCYFWPTGVGGPPGGSPGVVTLAGMRATIRQRADLVNSLFVGDAELNGWINSSVLELYDLLLQKSGNDYYLADPYTFTTDGVNDRYALPTNFYKLAGLEVQTQTNVWSEIPRFNFAERNRGGIGSIPPVSGRTSLRYRIMGGNLWLRSGATLPSANQTMRLWYAPRATLLVNDGDTFDGVSGWEEIIVLDCVIKCRLKGEEDPSIEMALKQAMKQRIEEAAENRDEAGPQTVSDVRGGSPYPDFYTAGGFD